MLQGHDVGRRSDALSGCPDRSRKATVPVVACDHVPVEVGHYITQGRQIDLGGTQVLPNRSLGGVEGSQTMHLLGIRQIGPFGHVRLPDDAVKARKVFGFWPDDPNNAQGIVAPDDLPTVAQTQRARCPTHTSTRSMPPALALATYSGIQFSPRIWLAISTTM